MIVVQHSTGRGIRGLVRYVLSDKASAGTDEHPTTSERVLWADTLGLPGVDPELMVRIMQGVTADQKLIKQRAGTSNRGRKLKDPYVHFSMNYGPGPRPSREQVMADSRSVVAAVGMGEKYYFIVVGHDDPHNSYHLVGCRIDPETGKAAKLAHTGLKLSRWAEQWEREHGGIRVLNRVKRRKVRERNARVLERCKKEGREPGRGELRAQPPMAPRRGRDHRGRSVRRTHQENREFTELQNRHRQEKTPQGQSRAERFELHVRHVVARGERVIGNRPIEQPEVPEPLDAPRQPDGPAPLMDFELSVQEPPPVEVPARPRQAEPVLESTPVQVPPPVRVPERPRCPEPVLEIAPAAVPPPVEAPARPRQAEPVLESTLVEIPPAVEVRVWPRRPEPLLDIGPAEVPPAAGVPVEPPAPEGRTPGTTIQEQPAPAVQPSLVTGEEFRRVTGRLENHQEIEQAVEVLRRENPEVDRNDDWLLLGREQRRERKTGRYTRVDTIDQRCFLTGAARRELERDVIRTADSAARRDKRARLGYAFDDTRDRPRIDADERKNLLRRAFEHLQQLVDEILIRAIYRVLGRHPKIPIAPGPARTPVQARTPQRQEQHVGIPPTTPPTARPTLPVPASTSKTPVQPPAAPAEAALRSRDMIHALGKPKALRALRRRFQGMDPQRDLKPLVVEIIDPQLLRVALGPDLASRWAPGLEKVYATIRERHPAHFDDIDEVWRRQREYWHALLRGKKRSSSPEPGARYNIARDEQHHEHVHRVELERRPDESDVRPVPTVAAPVPAVESPAAPAEERRLAGERRQLNVAQLEHGTGAAASGVEPQPATTTHDQATAAPGHREASPPPTEAPTPEPAAVSVTEPERVRLAVDAVKAILPRTQPYSGNASHRPPAVSDERFERLVAAAADEFVRKVITETQERQRYYTDFERRESEKTHLRPVIARKNRENVSIYEESEAERGFFSRRPRKPTWAEAETVVIQEFEAELLGVIEDVCRGIRQRSSAGARLEPRRSEPDPVSTHQLGRSPSGTQQPDRGHSGPSR